MRGLGELQPGHVLYRGRRGERAVGAQLRGRVTARALGVIGGRRRVDALSDLKLLAKLCVVRNLRLGQLVLGRPRDGVGQRLQPGRSLGGRRRGESRRRRRPLRRQSRGVQGVAVRRRCRRRREAGEVGEVGLEVGERRRGRRQRRGDERQVGQGALEVGARVREGRRQEGRGRGRRHSGIQPHRLCAHVRGPAKEHSLCYDTGAFSAENASSIRKKYVNFFGIIFSCRLTDHLVVSY